MMARIALAAGLLLGLSGGAAFAQVDPAEQGFYADPVLPDPAPVKGPVYRPAEVTADVAAVTPALDGPSPSRREPPCSARNPCAISTPARG